jgi:hypothetical protein
MFKDTHFPFPVLDNAAGLVLTFANLFGDFLALGDQLYDTGIESVYFLA